MIMPSWQAHFTTLARYNVWATERLLAVVAELPEQEYRGDAGLFFKSIHGTLNHLLVGEHHLWFVRFSQGTSPRVELDTELEPDRQRLAVRLREGAARWQPLIQSWHSERFEGELSYVTMRGQLANLPFSETLAHVFNHGTHHRGQITAVLTAKGRVIPELDLVYMLQEESYRS